MRRFAACASMLGVAACKTPPPAPVVQTPPVVVPIPEARVLDAVGAGDRAWAYASGPPLREAVLPDLLKAAGSLRADVQVGLAAIAEKCGFQPLLAVDELFVRIRWDAPVQPVPWAAVVRMQAPTE